MNATEDAVIFQCHGHHLVGIVHKPANVSRTGVLVVVGGPQYRVGSHRHFVLLARRLADSGIPAMRFDYRGIGDSGGKFPDFENIGPDIASAIRTFFSRVPSLEDVVLWGLCDAASAILLSAHQDPRISRIILVNPWVRTERGVARVYLKHYYFARIVSGTFWRKVFSGSFNVRDSTRPLLGFLMNAAGFSKKTAHDETLANETKEALNSSAQRKQSRPLPDRMLEGLVKFKGQTLFILSGNDLTADEFRDTIRASKRWQKALSHSRVTGKELQEANHTFSKREWRDQVADWTVEWIGSCQRAS